MSETLVVPALVRMERKLEAIELFHPDFTSLVGSASVGWEVAEIVPLGGHFAERSRAVIVRLERDETSIAEAKARMVPGVPR